MKLSVAILAVGLIAPVAAFAQGSMGGMNTKGIDQKSLPMGTKGQTAYKASGTVKKLDKTNGTVTLAHGPVKELKWPSMTMAFGVNDKSMLDKLSAGKKVDFEFVQQGKDYVVTSVK